MNNLIISISMASLQQLAINFIKRPAILFKQTDKAYNFVLNNKLPDEKSIECYKLLLRYCQLQPESAAVFEYHVTGNINPVLGKRLRHKTIVKIEELNQAGLPDYPEKHFYTLCEFLGDSPYLEVQKKIFERNLDPTPVDPLDIEFINKVKNAGPFGNINICRINKWNEREKQLCLEYFYDNVRRGISHMTVIEPANSFTNDIYRRIFNGSYNGIVKKCSSPEYNGDYYLNHCLKEAGVI